MSTEQAPTTTGDSGRITSDLWWLSGIMALGGFASLLDSTIINVAIGPLATTFDSQISTVQWVVTGYLLALSATIPLSGWASARFGAKQMVLVSQVLFLIGSVLAGLAWDTTSLIVFRLLQGIGGGMAVPVGQALLAQAAGPQRLGRLMGIVSIPAMFAPLIAPSLGGVLVDYLSWRWLFFINVPLCLATIVLAMLKVKNVVEPTKDARLDVIGLILLMPGLTAFLYGLSEAGNKGGFTGGKTVAGLVIGVVLLAAFALYTLRSRLEPLVDLRLFTRPAFRNGTLANLLLSIAMYGVMIPLPMYFQLVHGATVTESALLLLPQSIGYFAGVILINQLTAVLGVRNLTVLGVVLAVVATVPYGLIDADPNPVLLGVAMIVRGFGLGVAMLPTMTLAFSSAPKELAPMATSTFNVFQRVAASIGTAVLAVVLQQHIEDRLPAGGPAAVTQIQPGGDLAKDIATSFGPPFWWALVFTALAVIPCLLLPRRTAATRQAPREEKESESVVGAG
ncbi:DHA2 family efflux MFS transporter permease subunit [Streptomyces lanatus]|uniref:DHA2 family efflux MFS transporter permease subunit n=1 Tax=Streptomyces lanatus TaxID=66900 RepID=A0ABV1Y241_9ACTN|nr:DHA2 family efflux MFS transporter permease subunit [Streptomyces lanatus]GHH19695.1 MFS transporter [Streptomyces lanatus]